MSLLNYVTKKSPQDTTSEIQTERVVKNCNHHIASSFACIECIRTHTVAVLEEVQQLIEKNDPRGKEADPSNWGKTLRHDIESMKKKVTNPNSK